MTTENIEDFDTTLVAGNVKEAMKEAGAPSGDLWQVPPSQLRVIPGFNPRERNAKYIARVRWIADSIKLNGYYKDQPIAGYVARENGQNVIYVTGGHRRHEAVLLAISEGASVLTVPVVTTKGVNMEDLTVALAVGNDSEPLSMYGSAIICKRLAGFGWESAEIAKRLGYGSGQYVDDLLSLIAAPLAIRQMVIDEVVSATVAIEALAKHGDKALAVLQAGEKTAKESGAVRVTAKHLPGAAFKKALKGSAEQMFNLLLEIDEAKLLDGELSEKVSAVIDPVYALKPEVSQ